MTPPHNLYQRAIAAYQRGEAAVALEFLRQCVEEDPQSPVAANDFATVLAQMGRIAEAIPAYRRAIELAPGYPEAHNNLANLQQMTGALEEAVAGYRTALDLRPEYAEAHRNLASALRRLGRLDEAVASLATAVSLNPGYAEALSQLLHQLMMLCDWRMVDDLTAQMVRAVEAGSSTVNPFVFLTLETTPQQQRQCAEQWAQARHLPADPRALRRVPGHRITVGYLSADFQEHSTAHLISELIELHDRSRFRVIGYSYGTDDGSAARRRLQESFDSFVDLENFSHGDSAERIRADGVDILVDLKGYTSDARPQILALRPAPIQVNYLGYPGTLGTRAVDYILVDRFVVPADQQANFSEKLVHLPYCYQVNDRRREIAQPPTRTACGLPEDGFVFCCFNAPYKITARMFDVWMRLLKSVPGSVLWLLEAHTTATGNLRREAEARLEGGSARLVFAPTLANPEHLARIALADLFLDTLPYNAHTLSSDALWAGCPVLTCAGKTFPSRVAGSILHAAGLPELVTSTLVEYEALALRLAADREEFGAFRVRLAEHRTSMPLFDSPRFARDLEAAFEWMIRDQPD